MSTQFPGQEDASMIRVGVIGYGYWGPKLVRNFQEASGSIVVSVSDLRPERLAQAHAHHPSVKMTNDCRDLFFDPGIDAIAIATPASTHFGLAMQALKAGKHVLVEKPIATTVEQASLLVEEASRHQQVLMVDHTFVYAGAVRKIKDLVDGKRLGDLYYYDSVRANLGLFRQDVNVLWDLTVHDLAIMDYVVGARPCAVAATGIAHIPGQPADIACLTCFFDGNFIAHCHVNWLAPTKVRLVLIGGSERMIIYDDLKPIEKIRVYDKGVMLQDEPARRWQSPMSYRVGDVWAPRLNPTEALQTVALHFLECIEQGRQPVTDGQAGLRTVYILEAAAQSLAQGGSPVELRW